MSLEFNGGRGIYLESIMGNLVKIFFTFLVTITWHVIRIFLKSPKIRWEQFQAMGINCIQIIAWQKRYPLFMESILKGRDTYVLSKV